MKVRRTGDEYAVAEVEANATPIDNVSGHDVVVVIQMYLVVPIVPNFILEDGDATLSDSNAILVYLATRFDTTRQWLPEDAIAAADVQRYLSIASGKIAYGPAAARLVW